LSIVFDLERTNQLSLLPDKDLVNLCPPIEPYQVTKNQKKGSKNRQKARQRLAKAHLKVNRQRQDFAVKLARCVVHSSDVIAQVDLRVKNLVKNHCLAKSINDASWYQFREWIEYFGVKFGKITIAVAPNYTSQNCSNCGETVKKS
jgi:putative transposase